MMKSPMRRFNSKGISEFAKSLERLRQNPSSPVPYELLHDPDLGSEVEGVPSLDLGLSFANKQHFGKYLVEVLGVLREDSNLAQDRGLWTWLALAYFEQICPPDEDGARVVRSYWSYILSSDFRHHYRHLVRTPMLVYLWHGDCSAFVLSGELDKHGEAAEQLLGREGLITHKPLFTAIDQLYVRRDEQGFRIAPGARSKGAGSVRRLGKLLRQFDLTYDMRNMSPTEILDLLPHEFDGFRVT